MEIKTCEQYVLEKLIETEDKVIQLENEIAAYKELFELIKDNISCGRLPERYILLSVSESFHPDLLEKFTTHFGLTFPPVKEG